MPLLLTDFLSRLIKFYGIRQHIRMMDSFSPYFNGLLKQLTLVKEGADAGGSDIHAGQFYYFKNFFIMKGRLFHCFFDCCIYYHSPGHKS